MTIAELHMTGQEKSAILHTFSDRLLEAMENAHLDQVVLARISGIGRSSISRYGNCLTEAGITDLVALASALGVSVQWLLTDTEPTKRGQAARGCSNCAAAEARAERAERELASLKSRLSRVLDSPAVAAPTRSDRPAH